MFRLPIGSRAGRNHREAHRTLRCGVESKSPRRNWIEELSAISQKSARKSQRALEDAVWSLAWRGSVPSKRKRKGVIDVTPSANTDVREKRALLRILSYLRPHRAYVVAITGAIVGAAALDLAVPWIIGIKFVDEVLRQGNLAVLPWVIILLALSFVGK